MNSTTESRIRLSELPPDVLMHIIALLPVYDILSLRKVSNTFYAITNERSVWIDVLRSACRQHNVYEPSFPLMRMTIDELEHVATVCTRFNRRLRHTFAQTSSSVAPQSIRLVKPLDPKEEFEHLRFVPGGRFILSGHGCFLRIWDAGTPAGVPVSGPIASYELAEVTHITSVRTRASPVSKEEALVFVTSVLGQSTFRIHVLRIQPTACPPKVEPVCPDLVLPLVDNDGPVFLGATSWHIAVEMTGTVILWNFVDDSWISWPQSRTNFEDAIYVCDRHIVTVHADCAEVSLSPMPELKPRDSSQPFASPPCLVNLPTTHRFQIHRTDDPDDQLHMCISGLTLVFRGRETSPLFFDIASKYDGNVLLSHYAITAQDHQEESELTLWALGESCLPASYRFSHSLHLEWLGCGISEGRPCVQSFVVDGSKLHVCLTDVAMPPNQGQAVSSMGTLETPNLLLNELNVDFCSFSGRVCARVPAECEGEYKLSVMQYVGFKNT
ncbi:hypothetical protein C8F01DRAFT_1354363 [Mycena amicta]|nr:hypothetical protein C8F01DRAFT_1354363 [Mycena amicta]